MRAFRWATKLSVAAEPGELAPDTLIDLRSVLATEFDDVEIRFTETPSQETRVEVLGVIEARSGTEAIRVMWDLAAPAFDEHLVSWRRRSHVTVPHDRGWANRQRSLRNEAKKAGWMSTATGRVKAWHRDKGWGVLSGDELTGDVWVFAGAIEGAELDDQELHVGERVRFDYHAADFDPFPFVADSVQRIRQDQVTSSD
jgi:cold shock CspA family protein